VAGRQVGTTITLAGGSRGASRHWGTYTEVDPRTALLLLPLWNRHIFVVGNVAAILTTSFAIVTALVAALLVSHPVDLERCFLAHISPFTYWPVVFACIVNVSKHHQPVNLRYTYDTSKVAKEEARPGLDAPSPKYHLLCRTCKRFFRLLKTEKRFPQVELMVIPINCKFLTVNYSGIIELETLTPHYTLTH
jgi:hypothetical protein